MIDSKALREGAKGWYTDSTKIGNRRDLFMNNKDRIKYFYETVVSEHKLEELPDFISADCAVRTDADMRRVGIDLLLTIQIFPARRRTAKSWQRSVGAAAYRVLRRGKER